MTLSYGFGLTKNKNKINAGRSEVKMAIRYKSHHVYLISESRRESRFKSILRQETFLFES